MVCLLHKSVAIYRPRQPLESDFHRLIRGHFDHFRGVYGQRYARTFGFWRPVIDKAIAHFLKCGDPQHGFARVRCPECRHEFFVAFSCKQRCICPSCSQKRTVLFGAHVADDLCLDVPHRQFVWTIPKRLRIFFRFHRGLLHRLPPLAWQTTQEVYQAVLGRDDVTPGAIIATQTFGSLLHFHPHFHALVTDGAFTTDGQFLQLPPTDHEPLLRLWEHKVFSLLLDEGKIAPSLVGQIRSWRHSGFNVDRSVRLAAGDRAGLERLAQYMARSPFSLARLLRITPTGKVLYKADKEHCQAFPNPASDDLFGGVTRNFQVFEPLDFLAELTQHIPNKGAHPIRYYGCYANKTRGSRRKKAAALALPPATALSAPPLPQGPAPAAARRRWAALIKRVYQADPLRCPHCGGTMKVIAFIEARQGDVIERILRHCDLWQESATRGPPGAAPGLSPFSLGEMGTVPFQHPESSEQGALTYEPDPEFLDYRRLEKTGNMGQMAKLFAD